MRPIIERRPHVADAFGAILKFFGLILNAIYEFIPSYGVAIILLTIIVRIVLFPLAVKQIRSMTAMQKIQPKLKELQQKHKGDRQKLNEEMMKLYREHGVNPLGGCFPMLLQLPVFIALYAVIRAAVPFAAEVAPATPVNSDFRVTKATVCSPDGDPSARSGASGFSTIICDTDGEEQRFTVSGPVQEGKDATKQMEAFPSYIAHCNARTEGEGDNQEVVGMACTSPLGTGHLPRDGALFAAIVEDGEPFLGMQLACSPTQAGSQKSARACAADEGYGGGPALIGYYLLVVLMAGTTWYQQKQLLARNQGSAQAAQMAMMAKIMPVFMGFLSLNFPAALSLYWVIGNFWMIGQQHFILAAQDKADGKTPGDKGSGGGTPSTVTKREKPKPMQAGNGRPGGGKSGKKQKGKSGKRR